MDVLNLTKITIAWEMFESGIPKAHIASKLGINRETVHIWIKEISVRLYPSLTAKDGLDFLNFSFNNRFNHTELLQTDGGPEFKAEFRLNVFHIKDLI